MAKLSSISAGGTSFHGHVITTTVSKLREVIGDPQCECNDGSDKTNFDWTCETEGGQVFTIYDWKYYRELDEDEYVDFHIGAANSVIAHQAVQELRKIL